MSAERSETVDLGRTGRSGSSTDPFGPAEVVSIDTTVPDSTVSSTKTAQSKTAGAKQDVSKKKTAKKTSAKKPVINKPATKTPVPKQSVTKQSVTKQRKSDKQNQVSDAVTTGKSQTALDDSDVFDDAGFDATTFDDAEFDAAGRGERRATTGQSVEAEELLEPEPSQRKKYRTGPIRGRLVRRTVRQIDPWSVLRLSLLFSLSMWVISMIASVLLWRAAVESGLVGSIEELIEDLFQQELFRFEPDVLFRAAALGGLALSLGATAAATLMSVLFNLIADLVGGVRMLVVEEERSRRWLR